jgi:hypothetical protein
MEEDEDEVLQPTLNVNERIVKTLNENWYVVLHLQPIGMRQLFKTAYRRGLFRKVMLTNHRLLLIKEGKITNEVSLANIIDVMPHRFLRIAEPYLTLQLNDGSTIHLVFGCMTERIMFRAAVESEIGWRHAREWARRINAQSRVAKTTSTNSPHILIDTPAETEHCSQCGVEIPMDSRYCPMCGEGQVPNPH